jgi:hypothetical protein
MGFVLVVGPSLFGRDLAEQVQEDGQPVPIIVTKCIEAVETQGSSFADAWTLAPNICSIDSLRQ